MKTYCCCFLLILIFSCNTKEEQLRHFIENKPWIEDNNLGIPTFFKENIEYIFSSKNNDKLRDTILSLYLYKGSPEKPKEQ